MKTNNLWRFATIFFLSSAIFLTMVSCSQNANRSEESCPQEDTVVAKKIVYLPDSLEIKSQDELLDLNTPIGDPPTTSLVFINGERSRDFSNERLKNDTIKEIKEILKKRNYILDDIKILKDDKSLAKYRQGDFVKSGEEKWLEIVYEIKAHPIDQKGEIFEVTAQMPYYPGGGYKALEAFVEKNIHHPEKMLQDSIHGKVVVQFIIEKDGSIEEYGIVNNLLKDKSGNPCTNYAIKKLCEKEALRVFKMMPQRWEPGKNEKGEPVRVRLYFPILFFEKMPEK